MKRAIPAILIILLYGSPVVNGQFVEAVGLKAGVSLANQSYRFTPIDYTMETDPVTGPAVAVFMENFRKQHLSLQVDLGFAAKGSKTTTRSVTVNHLDNDRIIVNEGDLSVSRFYYLSLCPAVRYRIDRERLVPYAVLGPRLDLLLKYKTDSDYPLEEQKRIIVGLSGGVGLEFNLSGMGVFIEAQFQPDLSPVTGKDPLHVNNNILLFTVGVRRLNVR
jgi:hypothetical protein